MSDTRRRVKLYTLNEERQWEDRGTGHVSSDELCLGSSAGSLLLESTIQPGTAYQKQQDTLIVWSEAENCDLALSFQEKAGCDELWEKICQVGLSLCGMDGAGSR
uniref:PP4R3 EVH1-like domain-containing protein n=1 Tax=Sinocyclocheilus anshuiensis TaxID=1608454 RepID=A0A671S5Z1_9TELE